MRQSSWSLGRIFSNFGGGVRAKKWRAANSHKGRKFAFEPLEDRSLLSVCLWTGAVDNHWNNAGNWVNDQQQTEHVLPANGDTLQFAASPYTATINDLPAGMSFESLKFSANGFSLAGNSLALTGGITVDPGVAGAISLDIALANLLTVDVASTMN